MYLTEYSFLKNKNIINIIESMDLPKNSLKHASKSYFYLYWTKMCSNVNSNKTTNLAAYTMNKFWSTHNKLTICFMFAEGSFTIITPIHILKNQLIEKWTNKSY